MKRTLLVICVALLSLTGAAAAGTHAAKPRRDTTPPTVNITAPANGATVSATVTVTATASDNIAVDHVTFRIDGAAVASDFSAPYTYTWDTTTVANGAHAVSARAADTSNNVSTDSTVSVTVNNAAPDTTPPTVSVTGPTAGSTVSGTTTFTVNASDNVAIFNVTFFVDGVSINTDSTVPYSTPWDTTAYTDGTHTLSARAEDTSANMTNSAPVTVTVQNTVVQQGTYFTTEPVGTAGLPRDDLFCQANIIPSSWEPTSHGNAQYNVPRDDVATNWTDSRFSWWSSFPAWLTKRAQVDGHFTHANGSAMTTTELISMAACKWGVDEDLIRAVAVQESDWHQHFWGDRCNNTDDSLGIGSYGITQIKNFNCSNQGDWGGFRRTYDSTPFNLDFNAAAFRGCMDRNFWYTYTDERNGTAISPSDTATMQRACVSAWFAGDVHTNSSYVNSVYTHLANRDWEAYS